jgi:hypothetical protein
MSDHEDDGPQLPEGFEEVEATVCRRGEELIVFGTLEEGPFVFHLKLARKEEDPGPPPPGFGWTGEERPPKKGEWFWSELRGRAIQAVKDETGVNQFGEPTGGRKILKPLGTSGRAIPPPRTGLRLVKNEDPEE